MKTLTLQLFIFLSCFALQSFAQDTTYTEDTTKTEEIDPQKKLISDIIKEVNKRSSSIDNIRSEGEIKIKTPKIDESGSIEIKAKKKDDVWFKIEGPLGIDVAVGHFNRKKFIFLDDLNDELITGSTTILNIGTLTKIRCTFDDLLNSFSGTVRIPKAKNDILSMSDEGSQYVVSLKRGTITRKYWIDKSTYLVSKYAYYDKKGQTLIQFEFSNFVTSGDGAYAKRIEIRRPKKNEYFKLTIESVSTNQSYLDFKVEYSSDVKKKNWK